MAGLDGLEERDFNEDFLGGRVAQAALAIGQHFHHPRHGVGRGELHLLGERGGFGLGDFEELQVALRDLEDEQVAEVVEQVGDEAAEVLAALREVVQLTERGVHLAREHGAGEREQLCACGEAEHREHVGLGDFIAAKANELIERGLGIAHAAVRAARDGFL